MAFAGPVRLLQWAVYFTPTRGARRRMQGASGGDPLCANSILAEGASVAYLVNIRFWNGEDPVGEGVI